MVWYSYTRFYLRRGDLGSWKPPSGWGGEVGGGWKRFLVREGGMRRFIELGKWLNKEIKTWGVNEPIWSLSEFFLTIYDLVCFLMWFIMWGKRGSSINNLNNWINRNKVTRVVFLLCLLPQNKIFRFTENLETEDSPFLLNCSMTNRRIVFKGNTTILQMAWKGARKRNQLEGNVCVLELCFKSKKFSFDGLLTMKDGFYYWREFSKFFYAFFRKLQFIELFIIGGVKPILFCSIDFKF